MRRVGRLQGYQRPTRNKIIRSKGDSERKEPRTGPKWWFFKKEDVEALQLDHDYNKRRKAYEKRRNPNLDLNS